MSPRLYFSVDFVVALPHSVLWMHHLTSGYKAFPFHQSSHSVTRSLQYNRNHIINKAFMTRIFVIAYLEQITQSAILSNDYENNFKNILEAIYIIIYVYCFSL